MKEYLTGHRKVIEDLDSSKQGLSEEEALKRLEENGKNKLAEGKKDSLLKRFIDQLMDPMIIILIIAAVVSAATAKIGGEAEGYADVAIILFVVIVNAVLGVYQESKAEEAIEALQEIAASTSNVIREGEVESIKTEDVVPGDIIVLEAGDSIPADARIIENASLKIEESALTGESVPVNKQVERLQSESGEVPLGDRKNMCYMGSNVVYGRGKAVVTDTGMDTEMGKIADQLQNAVDNETPLQKKLTDLSKVLSYLVLGICVFIFAFDMLRAHMQGMELTLENSLEFFMVAVSLAVAAIPEGLAAVVTIVLSIGVTKMSKRNAVIRKLTAVETLGCTQVICSDKTGTLTQNKMTVVEYAGDDEERIAKGMALCSDAELLHDQTVKGEPTEAALVEHASRLGLKKYELVEKYPRVTEAPFDSGRKMMSTVHKRSSGYVQYTKGAPDMVLDRCTHAYVDGKKVEMTEDVLSGILEKNKEFADRALRVLCLAERRHAHKPSDVPEELERDLTYVGLVGMIDPVRPEVVGSIKKCKSAGIKPVMITGDHKDTAVAIAKDLGIIKSADGAITGAELDKIPQEDFDSLIETYSVYARVQPEHKVRIVKTWQKKNKITAMTGDGVNDAPSIKNADIGVGMGITGTDVTKNVADMVLADDNFATIVAAVEEGRRIYDNIRNSIQFLLSSNLAEVISIFIATILGFTLFEPIHLLWVNLITDSFPALALGMEKGEKGIMERPPRDSEEGIFAGGMGRDIFLQGLMIGLLTLGGYIFGIMSAAEAPMKLMDVFKVSDSMKELHQTGMTCAFITLSMSEIFHSFNMRSRTQSIFKIGNHNKYLYGSLVLSFILTLMVIYVPGLNTAFDMAVLPAEQFLICLGLSFVVIPVMEIKKAVSAQGAKQDK